MNANVDLEQVQKSIKQIEVSLQKISATEKEISSKYKELGNTWHDNKYQYLGSIVNECNSSLSKMRNQLESTLTSLRKIIVSALDAIHMNTPSNGLLKALYSTHPDYNDRVARLQEAGVAYYRYY